MTPAALGTSGYATLPDQRRLHYVTQGEGTPTVVFEAGMGCSRNVWGGVLPAVAEHTRVVAYDRSGLGRSDPDPAPRTVARTAADLGGLLDYLGDGPFVLVGHSHGGINIRVAAAATPDPIAGLVLVDPSDEALDLYLAPAAVRQFRLMGAVLPTTARLGLLRVAVRRAARSLPPDIVAEIAAEDGSLAAAMSQRAELAPFIDDLHELRAAPPVLPDVPLTVISGTRASRMGRARRDALVAVHEQRAATVPQGRHVRATGSAHLVMFTEPELVTAEILRVLGHAAVRSGTATADGPPGDGSSPPAPPG